MAIVINQKNLSTAASGSRFIYTISLESLNNANIYIFALEYVRTFACTNVEMHTFQWLDCRYALVSIYNIAIEGLENLFKSNNEFLKYFSTISR